jgi:UDPglucose 6-dehydrogenase
VKISIVGSGYVGLTTAVGLAGNGNNVVCIDVNEKKVDQINRGIPPFYEKGFSEKLDFCINREGSLKATTSYTDIAGSDVTFICVGTPCNGNGSIDLNCIISSAAEIGRALNRGDTYQTVVVRSTVIPGTTEKVVLPALEKSSDMKAGRDFGIAMNPEFLQEGTALRDFASPDRIIIGENNQRDGDIVNQIYHNFTAPVIRTTIKTAEMIKYASNAFLATKITFINEIGNICKKIGIDVYDVAKAIGQDPRIGSKFLNAGIGFGGSCLPKDVSALINASKDIDYEAELLQSILNTNLKQPSRLMSIVRKGIGGLENKVITVLGLAFKADTDDIRHAPALQIIELLLAEGARVKLYDPMAKPDAALEETDQIEVCSDIRQAIADSECVIIATEWEEFKDAGLYREKYVVDGRRVLDPVEAVKVCKHYEGICW